MKSILKWSLAVIVIMSLSILAGCSLLSNENSDINDDEQVTPSEPTNGNDQEEQKAESTIPEEKETSTPTDKVDENSPENEKQEEQKAPSKDTEKDKGDKKETKKPSSDDKKTGTNEGDAIEVVANPTDVAVLVNKQYKLPDNYEPDDLVFPKVAFIFNEKIDKRKMRKEAAKALENMFAAAEVQGIYLAGASGYRSHATQTTLYNNYVKKDGKEEADRYSARPGHSEHQTGLTMDVSGSTGKCAVQDCFADTPEADWIAKHAHKYGFIVRYPKGKEHITGYKYEPWHIRYLGTEIAKEIYEKDITLEEYYDVAIPVSGDEE